MKNHFVSNVKHYLCLTHKYALTYTVSQLMNLADSQTYIIKLFDKKDNVLYYHKKKEEKIGS